MSETIPNNSPLREKKNKSPISAAGTYFVLVLSIGAMTFFGMCNPQAFRGNLSGPAASVNGEEITQNEFVRMYRSQEQRLKSQYGDLYDPATLRLSETVLRQLISQRILEEKATLNGLKAADNEVVEALVEANAFRDKDGKYSEEMFREYLRSNRFTEASFMEQVKRDLTLSKLRQMFFESNFTPLKELELNQQLSETKLALDYISIRPSDLKLDIPPADVQAYLASDAGKAKVKAQFDAAHKKEDKTTLEEASSKIAENLLRAERMPTLLKDTVADLTKKIQSGGPLDDARLEALGLKWQSTGEFGLDVEAIPSIGPKPQVWDAALSLLKSGDVYKEPIKVGNAYLVIRLKSFTPGVAKPLDSVKASELQRSLSFSKGYEFFSNFEATSFLEYEEKHLFQMNPGYLALDKQAPGQSEP